MQIDKQNWSAIPALRAVDLCSSNATNGLSSKEAHLRLKQNGSFGLKDVPNFKLPYMVYTVFRDGSINNASFNELVFGDIVLFKKNDVIPAKARILKVDGLAVQEQNVTGIAAPAYKNTFIDHHNRLNEAASKNMLYPNSYILKGNAVGIIVDKPLKSVKTAKPSKKFAKKGLFMTKNVDKLLTSCNLIFFDGLTRPNDVFSSVQAIAIAKQIPCIYFLSHSLAIECATLMAEANTNQYNSSSLVSFFDTSIVSKAKIVTALNKEYKSLYIYGGTRYEPAASMATCDIVLTDKACHLAIVRAKIITKKINVNDLSGFLYNKK